MTLIIGGGVALSAGVAWLLGRALGPTDEQDVWAAERLREWEEARAKVASYRF